MTYNKTGGLNIHQSRFIQKRKKEVQNDRQQVIDEQLKNFTDGYKEYYYKRVIKNHKKSIKQCVEKQVWIERVIGKKISLTQYEMIKRIMRDNLF